MYKINQVSTLKAYFILFITLPLVGVLINYSPIPEADFWSIYERVYELSHYNLSSLWVQHNEHRVVITYLFAFLDNKYFGGSFYLMYFLIPLTFGLSGLLFYRIFFNKYQKNLHNTISFGFLLCLLFFWSQKPNFIFPFHISIVWVNLFTLGGLYLYDIYSQKKKFKYLIFSIVISSFAMISIVSGVLALPLVSILALTKKRIKDFTILILLSTFFIYAYFNDFQIIKSHSHFYDLKIKNLLDIYLYFFGYLGSIFSFLVGKGHFGLIISIIFGHLFLILCVYQFINFKISNTDNYLIIFLIFILFSALLTAFGRFEDGIQHAISSRYTTNSIYGWATLFILYYKNIRIYFYKNTNHLSITPLLVSLLLLMIIVQLKALQFDYSSKKIVQRSQELIALTLNVDYDQKRIPHLNSENLKNYLNSRLFNFKNDLFSPPYLNRIKFGEYNKVPIEAISEISFRESQNKNFYEITLSLDLRNIKKIYFLGIHDEIIGYAISENNFNYIDSKLNRFVGISKGSVFPTHILY